MRLTKVGWGVFTIMRTRHWKSVIPALLQQSVRLCPRKFLSFLSFYRLYYLYSFTQLSLINYIIDLLIDYIILLLLLLLLYYYYIILFQSIGYFCSPSSPIYRLYSVLLRLFIDYILSYFANLSIPSYFTYLTILDNTEHSNVVTPLH